MTEVEALSDDVLNYLETPEGMAVLAKSPRGRPTLIHRDKLPNQVRELVDIHQSKLPEAVFQRLTSSDRRRSDGYLAVDQRFAAFYMTLLATRICEQHGLGPLTYDPAADRLAGTAKLSATVTSQQPYWNQPHHRMYRENPPVPLTLAQGLSVSIVLEKLSIDPETPVDAILRFRERYRDELGRFRTHIGDLARPATGAVPLEALRQHTEDLYTNQIQPAYNDLKRALTSNDINHIMEGSLKIWGVSAPATSIPVALMHMSVPTALAASAAFSAVAGMVWYRRDKRNQLRNSPYTYLFHVEKSFSKTRRV
jgi:hypothetical protein